MVPFKSTSRKILIFSSGFRFLRDLDYFVGIDLFNLYDSLGDKLD
jgi:hypothetical protein